MPVLPALLFAIAAFVLLGFVRAGVDPFAPATLLALLIGAGVPAATGSALLLRNAGQRRAQAARMAALRRDTVESEILRLAARSGGRLTAVEVAAELGMAPEEAERALRDLMTRGVADVRVTESGLLVYTFEDVALLPEKQRARRLLDE